MMPVTRSRTSRRFALPGVPDDWVIVIGDIEGSTEQVEGRYKSVNLVGAAVIAAVLNALPDLDIPFVFGGDGAALVVPPTRPTRGRRWPG